MIAAPKVDKRTPGDIAAEVRKLLSTSLPGGWRQTWDRKDAGNALIGIFAHLCGVVIDRLNRAPEKNLLAFLDLLGASPRPAQPARVPLTFQLAAQHSGHVIVPALTQVAATPEKGEQTPVFFETEREIVITSATLCAVCTKDPANDRFSDNSQILSEPVEDGVPVFGAGLPIEHLLYFDLNSPLPASLLRELRLNIGVRPPQSPIAREWLQWEISLGGTALTLVPVRDETEGLKKSGEIVFQNLPDIPLTDAAGVKGQWLRCRPLLPLGSGTDMVSTANLPSLERVEVTEEFTKQGLPATAAVANQAPLDVSKDFFPFGERPKFGDTFYLAGQELLCCPGAVATLHVTLCNPETEASGLPIPPAHGNSVKLRWELWDGHTWSELGTSESAREAVNESTGFSDTTRALTRSGTLTFRVPGPAEQIAIGPVKAYWIRGRIVAGDYGHDVRYEQGPAGFTVVPPRFTPPCIRSIVIDYALTVTAAPKAVLAYDDFRFSKVDLQGAPVPMFRPVVDSGPCCYFGFLDQDGFSDRSMSLYFCVLNPRRGGGTIDFSGAAPAVVWEYWNGSAWTKWTIVDGTAGFTRAGIVKFLAPPDFKCRNEFGRELYWVRVRMRDQTPAQPRVRRIVLNTTMASQTITMQPEILGSSTGEPGQQFVTMRSPVLPAQSLEVRETTMPPADQQIAIRRDEGPDAIAVAEPPEARPGEVWVRWHEVTNFNASNAFDRHYVLDHATGEVIFGDGLKGRIPPRLKKNLRMTRYQTGGGAIGNRKANSINQLKSAIPYVDKVTNLEPAAGGSDTETYDDLLRRAPKTIRHRLRAVTAQDFEDMARLATSAVARARCLPLRDLSRDPDGHMPHPGVISLIIAPVGSDSETALVPDSSGPMPDLELIERVRAFLDAHRLLEADLVITGPDYVAVKVESEVTVSPIDNASEIELAVTREILRFLHPTKGGKDRTGWDFGQEPGRSDLFALIESVPGVDHVRELKVTRRESRPNAYRSGNFLICGVNPQVTATLEL